MIGVDGSWEQLTLARLAAPAALLVQADMTRLPLRSSSVDAVASFYALGHVPAAAHAPLFVELARWLRPGGLLLTSAPLGRGDSRSEDWLGTRMFFGGIGEQETREALVRAGLGVRAWQVVEEGDDEAEGERVRFLWLLAQKCG